MSATPIQSDPGGATALPDGLLEREAELEWLRHAVRRAADGAGSVTYIESPAGTGRSALLRAAAEIAAGAEARILTGSGRQTERAFAFGLALQLFEEHWPSAGPRSDDAFGAIHGLFRAARTMAASGGAEAGARALVLLVDDIHWADVPSLQFLAYLAARIRDLPVAMVATSRSGESAPDPAALNAVRAAAAAVLRPADLSAAAAAEIARSEFPDAPPRLFQACAELTCGNPLLLRALLDEAARAGGDAAPAIAELVPEVVVDLVRSRLAALAAETRSTAAAVAVLGDGAPLSQAAAVAGLSLETAARAADALAGAGVLHSGAPLSFTSPILAKAVLRSIPELEGALLRRRAEQSFAEDPAPVGVAAGPAVDASPPPGAGERTRLAEMAIDSSVRGDHRTRVGKLAELAWGDGSAWAVDVPDQMVAPRLAEALLAVDELELGQEILGVEPRQPLEPDDPQAGRARACLRAWILYHRGELAAALTAAQAGLAAHPARPGEPAHALLGVLAACHAELGELDQAAAALEMLRVPGEVSARDLPLLFDVRAQLELLQGRPADALADALEAGRRAQAVCPGSWAGRVAWRTSAALARLALDEPAAARQLAEEELDLARSAGMTRVIVRALRVLGAAHTGRRRLDLLQEAVAAGAEAPARLEYLHALVELGAATRRANRRSAARGPLLKAAELARELGAPSVAHRAQEELAAGTGPRQRRRTTGTEALTPSERRVALLAAQGRTTRQIAGELYVTPKTVEFHLRHVYRKLQVPSTRAELTRALLGAETAVSESSPLRDAGD